MKNIKELIGQLFIVGFKGETPPSSFLNFISEEKIGGVILFKDNCSSHQQVQLNVKAIHSAADTYQPFIAVDQEGGRVCRILGAPAEIASAMAYAEKLGIERFAEDYSRSMLYLESLGINVNLAPVADIYTNENNSCLDSRCFGRTAEEVIPFIKTAVTESNKAHILSCLKHFPGLGDATIDPHEATTSSDLNESTWENRERKVFAQGIKAGADMIMTTHIKLDQFDNEIVTGSYPIIERFIRQRLAFNSVVITDDLQMKGANSLGDIGERTIKAFNAGHDILLFGQNSDSAMEAYEHFRGAYLRGDISDERITRSLKRISMLKFKIAKSVLY